MWSARQDWGGWVWDLCETFSLGTRDPQAWLRMFSGELRECAKFGTWIAEQLDPVRCSGNYFRQLWSVAKRYIYIYMYTWLGSSLWFDLRHAVFMTRLGSLSEGETLCVLVGKLNIVTLVSKTTPTWLTRQNSHMWCIFCFTFFANCPKWGVFTSCYGARCVSTIWHLCTRWWIESSYRKHVWYSLCKRIRVWK